MGDHVPPPLDADLLQRSNAIGLRHLFEHLALLALTGSIVALTSWSWPLCSVATIVHAVVLSHLYMPFHEATHGTAFESASLCQMIAWPLGFVIIMNTDSFRYFHKEHHEQTQKWGRDPELPGANGSLTNYLNKLLGGEMAVALYHFGRSALIGERAEGPWVPDHARGRVVASTRLQCAGYALCAALAVVSPSIRWHLLHLWLLPLLVGQPAMWGHFIAQHTATDHDSDARHTARVVLTHPYTNGFRGT